MHQDYQKVEEKNPVFSTISDSIFVQAKISNSKYNLNEICENSPETRPLELDNNATVPFVEIFCYLVLKTMQHL